MAKSGETSDFWKRLTRARSRKSMSMDQADIGKELGLYQSAITKWKTGKGLPTLANAIKLATSADVCVEWLLTSRPPERPGLAVAPELARLIDLWDSLNPETAAEIVNYAEYRKSIQKPSSNDLKGSSFVVPELARRIQPPAHDRPPIVSAKRSRS